MFLDLFGSSYEGTHLASAGESLFERLEPERITSSVLMIIDTKGFQTFYHVSKCFSIAPVSQENEDIQQQLPRLEIGRVQR